MKGRGCAMQPRSKEINPLAGWYGKTEKIIRQEPGNDTQLFREFVP